MHEIDRQILKQRLSTEFYIQLYGWSLTDAYREANNGFPFLSTIRHIHISYHLEILKTFPNLEQVKLFVALTKNSYQKTGAFSQANIAPEEKILLIAFQQKLDKLPIYRTNIYQDYYVKKSFFEVKLKKLATLVRAELDPILGNAAIIERDYLEYRRVISNKWHIATAVNLDSTGISYDHLLSMLPEDDNLNDGERYRQRLIFSDPISLPKWLGFNDGAWLFFKEDDSFLAAKTIALACSHFLDSLPSLLSSIANL